MDPNIILIQIRKADFKIFKKVAIKFTIDKALKHP